MDDGRSFLILRKMDAFRWNVKKLPQLGRPTTTSQWTAFRIKSRIRAYGTHAMDVECVEFWTDGGLTPMIHKLALLALAGSLGTLARYGLAGLVHRYDGASFPWGTLAVNVTGCFLVGLLAALFESRWPVTGETRVILLVGFMGAFTTFSTFGWESVRMVQTGEWAKAALYIGASLLVGLVAMILGMRLGNAF